MLAKVKNYGIALTKSGAPQVTIDFECEDGKVRTWRGSLNQGKAQDITFKALDACGFSGGDPLELAGGLDTGLIPLGHEVDLTIGNEEYQGKTYEKVQWVNRIGGQGFKNAISKEDAVKKFAGMNLKASFAAHRKMNPKPKDEEPLF